MSPILGIYASQITGHLWNVPSSYESIQTVTVGAGGASSVTFSGIPSTYKHLQLRGIFRTNRAGSIFDNIFAQMNGDTGTSNYAMHQLAGNGSSASASGWGFGTASNNGMWVHYGAGAAAGANVFSGFVFDLLDYSNTSKYKTSKSLAGTDDGSSSSLQLASSLWGNTSAVNTITLISQNAASIQQYSSFALYGIKAI